jgi:hypothetical protein
LDQCHAVAAQRSDKRRKFRVKNKLMSLVATMIDLCASVFDWAHFRPTKAAVKLHLLLDHDGYLPSFPVITEGKHMRFGASWPERCWRSTVGSGLRLVGRLDAGGVYFVTRLKDNTDYAVVEEREIPHRRGEFRIK